MDIGMVLLLLMVLASCFSPLLHAVTLDAQRQLRQRHPAAIGDPENHWADGWVSVSVATTFIGAILTILWFVTGHAVGLGLWAGLFGGALPTLMSLLLGFSVGIEQGIGRAMADRHRRGRRWDE